jgi:hypothetical protein
MENKILASPNSIVIPLVYEFFLKIISLRWHLAAQMSDIAFSLERETRRAAFLCQCSGSSSLWARSFSLLNFSTWYLKVLNKM